MHLRLKLSVYQLLLIAVLQVLTTGCGKDEDINDAVRFDTFVDQRDGNQYKTIKIGNQVWMAENLRYLPYVVKQGEGSYSFPCYYVYGYDGTSVSSAVTMSSYGNYGVLYNWAAAQTACPPGWHLPSFEEWKQMIDYLGGESVAGGKLKESGTAHWRSTYATVTNETNFTALPGGFFDLDGTFKSTGYRGYWWTTSEGSSPESAWFIHISYNSIGVGKDSFEYNKVGGLSVRCVKD
jgi:uncharacterized protein (TIGR02145 family)